MENEVTLGGIQREIREGFGKVAENFERVDEKLSKIDKRLGKIETNIDSIHSDLIAHDERTEKIIGEILVLPQSMTSQEGRGNYVSILA